MKRRTDPKYKAYQRQWWLENRDRAAGYNGKRYRYKRIKELEKKYGLTIEQYEDMVEAQEGRCGICNGKPKVLHVDHCHSTGEVRGLLCFKCNAGIGLLGEENIDSALKYLRPLTVVRNQEVK